MEDPAHRKKERNAWKEKALVALFPQGKVDVMLTRLRIIPIIRSMGRDKSCEGLAIQK
jgi:hypothetical protein